MTFLQNTNYLLSHQVGLARAITDEGLKAIVVDGIAAPENRIRGIARKLRDALSRNTTLSDVQDLELYYEAVPEGATRKVEIPGAAHRRSFHASQQNGISTWSCGRLRP